MRVEHLRATTFHGRQGRPLNRFRYRVDYLLLDPEAASGPALFARNRANLFAVHDRDHGGPPGRGTGAAGIRAMLAAEGLPPCETLLLLAQPRVLGHVFNPVSFWLCLDGGSLRAVVAEVTNTFGDRHWYVCAHPDGSAIGRGDILEAAKMLHVSPFQPRAGSYRFRFDIRKDRVGIWIDFRCDEGGLYATFTARRRPLTSVGILGTLIARPFGSRRVLGLIHWQALKLWLSGALYRTRPAPRPEVVSR